MKVHNTLININITAISAPEMTYTPKHHCEAQIHQIRIKGYPYYLYFDEFLNIFHYIRNAILCAYNDLRGRIMQKMGGKYIT